MRKMLLLCTLLLVPLQVAAVSNLRLNGAPQYTVTSLPVDVVMTCDLAGAGNSVEMEIFLDVNHSGTLEGEDVLVEYLILTDGIGWIRDPDNPDEDIAGDETPLNGKLKTTASIEEDDDIFFAGQFLLKLTDEDGSTATAKLNFDIQLEPPLITGKVTDASSGLPLPYIIILAERDVGEDDYNFAQGMTDENGDYVMSVDPGTWRVQAIDYIQSEYQSSDTMDVTVGEGETKTLNIQLHKYDSFIDGFTKKQDGTPVPGIYVYAFPLSLANISLGRSDETGYYKMGVNPGQVMVSASFGSYIQDPSWPAGYYSDPEMDTVTVQSGQTVRVDFTFRPYTTFIEGDCTVDQTGLAGVSITAMSMDFQTFEFHISFALSDAFGHYRIGVMPGTVSMLTAEKEGYDMTSPIGGYMGITIAEGQTITGKDFTFSRVSGEMSISGRVTYEGGGAAGDVYVVAVLDMEDSPEGYLITYTDGSGDYHFGDLMEGNWKVGVYEEGYRSTPSMIYEFMFPGTVVSDADFVLQTSSAIVKGDVNDDGEIDLFDLLIIVNHILGTETLDPDDVEKADCNSDGVINLLDLVGIVNVILGTGECEPGDSGKETFFSKNYLDKMYLMRTSHVRAFWLDRQELLQR